MAEFVLRVNGRTHRVEGEPGDSLLAVLRDDLGLTGSKFGCGEGHCGACTVMIDGQATRSCVVRLGAVAGKPITTIEGIAPSPGTGNGDLHPVQQAFIDSGGVQCGFCTPGMIMAAKALLDRNPRPTLDEVRLGLAGNLCRCTGYTKIYEAVLAAAERTG